MKKAGISSGNKDTDRINKTGKNEEQKEDKTIADKIIPQTGVDFGVGAAIIMACIIAIFTYKKYNKYKSIK